MKKSEYLFNKKKVQNSDRKRESEIKHFIFNLCSFEFGILKCNNGFLKFVSCQFPSVMRSSAANRLLSNLPEAIAWSEKTSDLDHYDYYEQPFQDANILSIRNQF